MDTLKKRWPDHLIGNVTQIHETFSCSNGFFWLLITVTVKSMDTIHYMHLFLYSRNTMGFRTEVDLRGIRAKLVFSFANTAFKLSVTWASKVKQASTSTQGAMTHMLNSKFSFGFVPVSTPLLYFSECFADGLFKVEV